MLLTPTLTSCLAAATCFLSGCSGAGASPASGSDAGADTARASFQPRSGHSMYALTSGVLGGDPSSGCLWLTNNGQRYPVVIQHDHARADFQSSPPGIWDGGILLVPVGDEVQMGGGFTTAADPDRRCTQDGQAFLGGLLLGSGHPG